MEVQRVKFRLKELFVFSGFKFFESFAEKDSVLVELKRTKKTGKCPKCGVRCNRITERYTKRVRDLDIANIRCYVEFPYFKINCRCGFRGYETLDFVDRYSRFTKRFEEKVAILCKVMTLSDVANEMMLGWETVKNIDKKEAKKYMTELSEVSPKRIGVDEIAYEKGQKYLTVVRDVDIGKVIWVAKGRKVETLDKFFTELGEDKSKSMNVAVIDMWDPYIKSITKNAPQAEIVFDKFHVAKKVNDAVDKIRKKEFANADPEQKKIMKKKRFLVLRRNKNLDSEQKENLDQLMENNNVLYKAYLLKEQILDILDSDDTDRLSKWFSNVAESGFDEFAKVVKTMKRYLYGIMNYFKHKITNAASEAFNTKINVIKRRAYGFRDLEYFMLKIIQLCGTKS